MWSRGGRSTALERAQALLSERYEDKTPGEAVSEDGSSEKRAAALPTRKTTFLDLSDLSSSASSGTQHGHSTTSSTAAAGERQGREGDLAPQSSGGGGGGGSRFLKKAAPPAASSKSPAFSKSQRQQPPQPSSQSAALSRLAAIEERSRKHAQTPARSQTRDGPTPASDLGISPPPPRPQDASTLLSPQSSVDLGLKGKRFLKRTTVSADGTTYTAAVPPKDPHVSFQTPADTASRLGSTRRAAASTPLARSGAEPIRAAGSRVSLDSDEEDMRRLLGDSLDWTENSLCGVGRTSSKKTAVKPLGKSSQKISPTPPPTAVRSSSLRHLPHSPPSPPWQGSPLRFSNSSNSSNRAGAHWSPSPFLRSASAILSPSPSPRYASLSSPPAGARSGSYSRAGVLPRSLSSSSISDHSEAVRSLTELFPVGPSGSEEEAPSERSEASSDDFKINVMTLDDLAPVSLWLAEGTVGKPQKETKPSKHKSKTPPLRILTSDQQLPGQQQEEIREEETPPLRILTSDQQLPGQQEEGIREEEAANYESDFESESRSEPEPSASEISERLGGDGEEGEGVSEASKVIDELESESDRSRGRTRVDEYTSASFSEDGGRSYATRTSSRRRTFDKSLSRGSSYSDSDSDWSSSDTVTPSHLLRCSSSRRAVRRTVREAAVQTHPDALGYTWSTGMAALGPSVGMTYVDPTPIASHTVSAEAVEALSAYSPAALNDLLRQQLNDLLRQQLALTRHFIHTNKHMHSSLLHSLGPADYTYTTLEDTKQFIHRHKPPKLTEEEALEEVLQEMRDYHYI